MSALIPAFQTLAASLDHLFHAGYNVGTLALDHAVNSATYILLWNLLKKYISKATYKITELWPTTAFGPLRMKKFGKLGCMMGCIVN